MASESNTIPPSSEHERSGTTTDPAVANKPKDQKQLHQASGSADKPASSALRSDTVYRLRGVPERFQQSDIPGLLREALGRNDEFPVKVGSLAQSPYRVGEKIATVTLPYASSVLPEIKPGADNRPEWPLSLYLHDGGTVDLHLDTHFYGFTPLHNDKDAVCARDIIAISGLNGHAFGSFKQRGGPWMWLRDGLAKDLPNTRIFIYGYDTKFQGTSSAQNLTDVGLSLRTALNDILHTRNANSRPRPLSFVGHSLGGLVIKETFLHMGNDPICAKILEATCGFLFFGVPNLGMAMESMVPMVDDQPNRSFIEALGRNSPSLRRQREEFSAMFMSKPVQVMGFYETKLSRTACKVDRVWKMQGPETLLVDFASATVGCDQYHPIDQGHSNMVKFNNVDDLNYRAALSYVRQLSNRSSSPTEETGNTAPLSKDDKKCLSSLAFPAQDWHKDGVVTADRTCDWIFSHDAYKDWDANSRQLLWIRGNPGTGKSTMMKHIFQSLDERRPKGETLATFFFNGRREESLTTLLSLYRALLNQILHQSPEHLSGLTSKFKEYKKSRGRSWKWTLDDLSRHFAKVVPAIAAKRHICILVDALDESGEEDARELVEQFQETLAAANEAGGVLKICFSCRHYPILTLEKGMTITMETENKKDIEVFVKKRLRRLEGEASLVEKAILQKAQGVFQWAKLVAKQASDLHVKGKTVGQILLRIEDIPVSLKELYRSLLIWSDEPKDQEERKKALELFQCVLFAAGPFTLPLVRFVLDIDDQLKDTPLEEYLESVRSTGDDGRFRRAVRTISRGLVEFRSLDGWYSEVYYSEQYALQPIHQTVREYLLETGLQELQGSTAGCSLADPHYQIFKTTVRFLFLEARLKKPLASDRGLWPGLHYSLTYLGCHFIRTDQNKVDPEELLDLFQWPLKSQMPTEWVKWFQENDGGVEDSCKTPCLINDDPQLHFHWPRNSGSTLLHLAAFVGNTGILESAIRRDNGHHLHAEDEMGWTPLSIAVGQGHEEIAVRILSHNQDFEAKEIDLYDNRDPYNKTTIIHEAARCGYNRTLNKLLEVGVHVDGPDGCERSPLFEAVTEGQLEACQILLNHQANPEIMAWGLKTPLSAAIEARNKELARLLVQNPDKQPSRSPPPTRANVYNALWPASSAVLTRWGIEYTYAESIFQDISGQEHGDFIREVLRPISTPLHDACARGNTKVASFLIDKVGFDVNGMDDEGRSPAFRAVQAEQHDMIRWLFRNHQVLYLSEDDWSQLPGNISVKETYRQMVEEGWCGTLSLPSSQPQEDESVEQLRQWALKAIEISQYSKEAKVGYGSYLQGPDDESDPSSSLSNMGDNYVESNTKRRRIM